MKTQFTPYKKLKGLVAATVAVAFAASPAVFADEIEWDPTWGYHEEEWYDPSDWFNDDGQVDYEDTYDYDTNYWGSDYNAGNDAYYADDYWYDTYDYDYVDYGFHYVWDSAEQKWETDYGYHTGSYDIVYTPAMTAEQQQQQMGQQEGRRGPQQTAQRDRQQERQDRQQQTAQRDRQQDRQQQTAQRDQQQERQDRQQQTAQRDQQQDRQDRAAQQQMAQSPEDREAPGRRLVRTTISGTVDGFRKMNLDRGPQGQSIEQTLARVTLENGESYVVAMGDRKITDKLKPKTGDQIEVSGIRAMINGMPAIVASEMTIGDRTVNIEREAAENIAFTGTIENFGKAEVTREGEQQNHLLVSLRFEEGQQQGKGIVVDFGPNQTLKDLNLKKGDKISVVGRKAMVGDKAVLVAREFNIVNKQPNQQDQASAN